MKFVDAKDLTKGDIVHIGSSPYEVLEVVTRKGSVAVKFAFRDGVPFIRTYYEDANVLTLEPDEAVVLIKTAPDSAEAKQALLEMRTKEDVEPTLWVYPKGN